MRKALTALLALAALSALVVLAPAVPADHNPGGNFIYGVAAGDVTSDSAILWTRSEHLDRVILEVTRDRDDLNGCPTAEDQFTFELDPDPEDDRTVQRRVQNLQPGTRYFYRFCTADEVSDLGRFTTAPSPGSNQTIRFAFSGDTDAQPLRGSNDPFWNDFEVFRRMVDEGNHFNVHIGDTIYSDTSVGVEHNEEEHGHSNFHPAAPDARSVEAKWNKYKQNLDLSRLQRIRSAAGFYSHWDDHELINDFSIPEHGEGLHRRGVQAFRDYAPVTYTEEDGLYRSFRWGENLELFFLDQRSFRDAKASDGGTCDNPQSDEPDLAPTAPQDPHRNTFALLIPELSQPVSQECKDRINDPDRTFLGQRQLNRFKDQIESSDATFKVVMNETPIQQFYALPYDRWEGYAHERGRLLRFLRDNVDNVVFLTTDTHGNMVNDARLKTLEQGGPVNTGILEVVTGPVATETFSQEIESATGVEGAGETIRVAFFKPQPPAGVGMQCASLDVYSYSEVTVTQNELTIQPKDLDGQPVTEPGGAPCGPFVVNAQ